MPEHLMYELSTQSSYLYCGSIEEWFYSTVYDRVDVIHPRCFLSFPPRMSSFFFSLERDFLNFLSFFLLWLEGGRRKAQTTHLTKRNNRNAAQPRQYQLRCRGKEGCLNLGDCCAPSFLLTAIQSARSIATSILPTQGRCQP